MNTELNLLTLQDAMDFLQISRSTVNRWRRDKGFPCIKIGRDVYVDQDQLHKWIRQHVHILKPSDTQSMQQMDRKIVIGYHSKNAHLWSSLVIKQLRLFEEGLRTHDSISPVRVEWVDLNGPRQMEEMVAGRIHIASLADLPLMNLYKLSNLLPSFQAQLLAFDGKSPFTEGISLALPRGSKIRNVQHLSNRTIKTLLHSGSWHRLNKFLYQAGITDAKIVSQQNLEPIELDQSDASALCEPYLSMISFYQLGRILNFEGCEDDYLTGIVAENKWISQNEDLVIAYLKAHLRAQQLMRKNPKMISKIISKYTNYPFEVIFKILSKIRWDAAIYKKDLHTLNALGVYDGISFQNSIDHLHFENLKLNYVNDQYLKIAAKKMKLPFLSNSILQDEWIPHQVL